MLWIMVALAFDDKPDPALHLGTVAVDADDLEVRLSGDPLLATPPACPHLETVETPTGPRIDPEDPHGVQLLTFHSDPRRPGTLCSVSCLLSTTDCWVSTLPDCTDAVTVPHTFPSGRRGTLSALYVCVQATTDSPIPLRETVTITTSNDPDGSIFYLVKGSD
jgi:hypothetical protein